MVCGCQKTASPIGLFFFVTTKHIHYGVFSFGTATLGLLSSLHAITQLAVFICCKIHELSEQNTVNIPILRTENKPYCHDLMKYLYLQTYRMFGCREYDNLNCGDEKKPIRLSESSCSCLDSLCQLNMLKAAWLLRVVCELSEHCSSEWQIFWGFWKARCCLFECMPH